MTRVTKQVIRRVLEISPLRAPSGKAKNKLHQMALHSAAPDESAKRMCQSANRFSGTSLMYPWVWPGGLCCVKNLPQCFECSKMEARASVTAWRPHSTWRTSGEGVLITSICILVICTKTYRMMPRFHQVLGLFPLGVAWELGENCDLRFFLECLKHYPATVASAEAQSDTAR